MLKLIAIMTGCCLTLAVSVQAAEPVDEAAAKKPVQKSKSVQKQQQISPKQHTAPNTHVQTLHTQRPTNAVHNTVHSNVSKKQVRTVPAVQSSKLPTVQSKKIQTNKQQLQTNTQQLQANKLNKQTVKKIQSQHLNFHAKPNTAIASAQFNPNYRIQAAQNWSGAQYNAYRSYQPRWHDRSWWGSHYTNLSFIGGGWYFWDGGYWYPAWGYDEGAAYYPYDGPIYVGPRARPFDQVVADVQAVLQEQGYYHGEVDGLVGPLTQEALAAYQSAQGLPPTAAIDQPTLNSLGLG
jgi:1,2-phenylacetyl-CoA epoxidase PaaB subunit